MTIFLLTILITINSKTMFENRKKIKALEEKVKTLEEQVSKLLYEKKRMDKRIDRLYSLTDNQQAEISRLKKTLKQNGKEDK